MELGRPDLIQVLCPFADTARPDGKGPPQPTEACVVFVRTLPPADRQALAEMLPDDWAERVRWIFAETVCDGHGVLPSPQLLADTFARFDLPATERVHRAACAANQIPYMEYPRDGS